MESDTISRSSVNTFGNPYFHYKRSNDPSLFGSAVHSVSTHQSSSYKPNKSNIPTSWLLLCLLSLFSGAVIGIIFGSFGLKDEHHCESRPTSVINLTRAGYCINDSLSWENVLSTVSMFKLRDNLRVASKHLVSLARDNDLVNFIESHWKEIWLDAVKTYSYDIFMSSPDPKRPNKVLLLNDKGKILFTILHKKQVLKDERSHPKLESAFNTYETKAIVQGELVYVNYAREEDFDELLKFGVTVSGYICIARYGKIFEEKKVLNAKERGAMGILFFLDIKDTVTLRTLAKHIKQNRSSQDPSDIWKDSVFVENYDQHIPVLPFRNEPHKETITRINVSTIPFQRIGYEDAKHFLQILDGNRAPESWIKGFDNLHVGPGFLKSKQGRRVQIEVYNIITPQIVKNVIGVIKGKVETDRYVILGNHRDAWGYGAANPSSGTAQLLEVVRVIGELKRQGWRPYRTIIFASWAAAEYRVLGTEEWLEDMNTILSARGVAVIDSDICIQGPNLEIAASPMLYNVAIKATKKVMSPKNRNVTLYEDWCLSKELRSITEEWKLIAKFDPLNDDSIFFFYSGIPTIDLWFQSSAVKHPLHHSGIETFNMKKGVVDPTFRIHKACTQLVITVLLDLTENVLLPFDIRHLADSMNRAFDDFKNPLYISIFLTFDINFDLLGAAVKNFSRAAYQWHEHFSKELSNKCKNSMRARVLNDQLMEVERTFIFPEGLPGNPYNRHFLLSPVSPETYEGNGFYSIKDLLYRLELNVQDMSEIQSIVQLLKEHVSDIIHHIVQATNSLELL